MWSPTTLVVNGRETHYPLPEPVSPLNFNNSTGMRYEAEEVRQCVLKGTVAFGTFLVRMNVKKITIKCSEYVIES